jgi:hypothetical protein
MRLHKGTVGTWRDLLSGYYDLPFNKIGYAISYRAKKAVRYLVVNKDKENPLIMITNAWRLVDNKR